jgi:FKBP-type peptidyl-prolyl cis-trans isomerase (trigger factor)
VRASLVRNGLISPDDVASDAALKEKVRPQAEKDVRLSYLFKSVAVQEKIDVTPEDINEMKEKTLASNADNKEAVEKYFTENDLAIRASVLEKKIVDFIKQHAKMKVVED